MTDVGTNVEECKSNILNNSFQVREWWGGGGGFTALSMGSLCEAAKGMDGIWVD